MRSAVLLGVGIASVFAAGIANAQTYAQESGRFAGQAMLPYAQETLPATGATTLAGDPVPYATVRIPTSVPPLVELRIRDWIFRPNDVYFMRLDFTGLRVTSGYIVGSWADSDTPTKTRCITSTRRRGTWIANRRDGRSAVYQLTGYNDPGNSFDSYHNWCILVDWDETRNPARGNATVQLQPGTATVTAQLYEDLSDALNGNPDGVLVRTSELRVIPARPGYGYTVPAAAKMAFVGPAINVHQTVPLPATTASVERGFAAFLPRSGGTSQVRLLVSGAVVPFTYSPTTATRAEMATVEVSATNVQRRVNLAETRDRDNFIVNAASVRTIPYLHAGTGAELTGAAAAQLIQSAKVDLKGDFSQGTFLLARGQQQNCPGRGVGTLTLNDAKTVATGTYAGAAGCTFTMDVKENADNEAAGRDFFAIKAQKFTADVDITLSVSSPLWPPAKRTDLPAGEIVRDGTTVHLPFLTTRPGYMQRLVLVNRGTKAADFWVENVSSADGTGATAVATAATPMNVAAGSRTAVAVSDLVNLGTGGTEGAATLSVNAARRNVAVATTITNMASNSTDTMTLEPNE